MRFMIFSLFLVLKPKVTVMMLGYMCQRLFLYPTNQPVKS